MSRSSRAETVRALESLGAIAVIRLDEGPKVRPVVEALAAGERIAIVLLHALEWRELSEQRHIDGVLFAHARASIPLLTPDSDRW